MNAREKLALHWKAIVDSPYPGALPSQAPDEILQTLAITADKHTFLAESWTHTGDELPASRNRRKLIHRAGTTAMVEWEALPGHRWSGLLASGGIGLLRVSLTSSGPEADAFTPGLAVKLFIDGEHASQNLVAAHRFEGFDLNEPQDFFRAPLATQVSPPRIAKRMIFRRIQWNAAVGLFRGALAWRDETPNPPSVFRIPLEPFCTRHADGTPAAPIVAPETLTFLLSPEGSVAWHAAQGDDFRDRFAMLPSPLVLMNVFDHQGRHVARLHLTSGFRTSLYGDNELFFQHAHQPKSDK